MHAPVDCEMPPGTIGETALKLKSELRGRSFPEAQDRCDESEARRHKEILEAGSMVDRRQLGMTGLLDNPAPREISITVKQELEQHTPRAIPYYNCARLLGPWSAVKTKVFLRRRAD
jgi:hypothetical protein